MLAIGRLIEQKDHATLLRRVRPRARRSTPTARLAILGWGPLEEQTRALAHELGLADAVVLPGRVEPRDWLERADVFVHTSRWEGFGHRAARGDARRAARRRDARQRGPRDRRRRRDRAARRPPATRQRSPRACRRCSTTRRARRALGEARPARARTSEFSVGADDRAHRGRLRAGASHEGGLAPRARCAARRRARPRSHCSRSGSGVTTTRATPSCCRASSASTRACCACPTRASRAASASARFTATKPLLLPTALRQAATPLREPAHARLRPAAALAAAPRSMDADDPFFTPREVELLQRPERPGLRRHRRARRATLRGARRREAVGRDPAGRQPRGGYAPSCVRQPARSEGAGEVVVGWMAAHLLTRRRPRRRQPALQHRPSARALGARSTSACRTRDSGWSAAPSARVERARSPGATTSCCSAGCRASEALADGGELRRRAVRAHGATRGSAPRRSRELIGLGVPTVSYDYEVTANLRETGAGDPRRRRARRSSTRVVAPARPTTRARATLAAAARARRTRARLGRARAALRATRCSTRYLPALDVHVGGGRRRRRARRRSAARSSAARPNRQSAAAATTVQSAPSGTSSSSVSGIQRPREPDEHDRAASERRQRRGRAIARTRSRVVTSAAGAAIARHDAGERSDVGDERRERDTPDAPRRGEDERQHEVRDGRRRSRRSRRLAAARARSGTASARRSAGGSADTTARIDHHGVARRW